jgi:hypothetical protein
MTRDQQVTAIAEAFAEIISNWLSIGEFTAMKHKNESNPVYVGEICASHDYCDSDSAMLAAFQEIMNREPVNDSETDAALWSDSWTLARKLYLGFQR